MLNHIIHAFIYAVLPIFIFTTLVLFWLNHRGHHSTEDSMDELSDELEEIKSTDQNKQQPFIHKKWLQFGGGFYGMVALLTYFVTEWNEIVQLVAEFKGIEGDLLEIIISFIIKFFIESVMNIIVAVTWPIYWMRNIDGGEFWLLFIGAYLGYYLGEQAARILARKYRANYDN